MSIVVNSLRDINGVEIKSGCEINCKSKTYVVFERNGDLGFTEKYKNPKFCYQDFLRFLDTDDYNTFLIKKN